MTPFKIDSTLTLPAAIVAAGGGSGVEMFIKNATKCIVKERANGIFYAEITVPTETEEYEALRGGGLLWIVPNQRDSAQCFRIASESAGPLSGTAVIKANHISYDLLKSSVVPFTGAGSVRTFEELQNPNVRRGGVYFRFETDIYSDAVFYNRTPQSARAIMAGQYGSIQEKFGGEWKCDNLLCSLLTRRGVDSDLLVMYGRNIVDYRQEKNLAEMYTHVQGYAMRNGTAILGSLIELTAANDPQIINVDVSGSFASGVTPTTAQVDTETRRYIAANNLTQPKINIKVDFADLSKTEEYKSIAALERCGLFDSVLVRFPAYGIDARAKVIEYEYDALLGKYNYVELGNITPTLPATLARLKAEVSRLGKLV